MKRVTLFVRWWLFHLRPCDVFLPSLSSALLRQCCVIVIHTSFRPFSLAHAAPTAPIQGQLLLPDGSDLNTTRITLNDGEQTTYTRPDGTFTFYHVPPGVHLLDVQSQFYHFSQVKVQLLEESMDAPKCIEYAFPGAPKTVAPYPILLTAHAKYEYFEKQQGFAFSSILKNPMMLMMIFSVGLMFVMPMMMDNLDPEDKERMQKQMEMQSDPQKMLSELMGGLTGAPAQAPVKKASGKSRKSRRD